MAGIKNQEVSAILREWIQKAGISQAEAARQLNVSPPVLWRQLEGKDSIPYSRVEQIVNLFAPSDSETSRLENLMNEVLSPSTHKTPVERDFRIQVGKLDLIAQMLRNAVAQNVPENMRETIITMADSIVDIASSISGQKKVQYDNEDKFYTLPRKSKYIWKKIELQNKINNISSLIMTIDLALLDEDKQSKKYKNHSSWMKVNGKSFKLISSNLHDIEDRVNRLDQIDDPAKLEQAIKDLEPAVSDLLERSKEIYSSWNMAIR